MDLAPLDIDDHVSQFEAVDAPGSVRSIPTRSGHTYPAVATRSGAKRPYGDRAYSGRSDLRDEQELRESCRCLVMDADVQLGGD